MPRHSSKCERCDAPDRGQLRYTECGVTKTDTAGHRQPQRSFDTVLCSECVADLLMAFAVFRNDFAHGHAQEIPAVTP